MFHEEGFGRSALCERVGNALNIRTLPFHGVGCEKEMQEVLGGNASNVTQLDDFRDSRMSRLLCYFLANSDNLILFGH